MSMLKQIARLRLREKKRTIRHDRVVWVYFVRRRHQKLGSLFFRVCFMPHVCTYVCMHVKLYSRIRKKGADQMVHGDT